MGITNKFYDGRCQTSGKTQKTEGMVSEPNTQLDASILVPDRTSSQVTADVQPEDH
jgi:hypothetical protein